MESWPASILVADDASPEADHAVDAAVALARSSGAGLSLLHVKSLSPYLAGDSPSSALRERMRAEGEAFMQSRIERVRERGATVERHWVRLARSIESEVVRVVEVEDIDLLVVPKRGHSLPQRRALGDLSLRLVRDAPCSVLVVRAPGTPPPRRRVASTPRRADRG